MRVATINNSMISKGQMRMEGKFFLNETSLLCMPLERNADKCVTLETVADVMNPPVFKRQFCSPTERAVQYFQSSDVNIASESSSVFVYKPQAERIKAIVHKGDILVTGFGTIGNARLISRHQDGVCYANNVARIRTKGEVLNGYIYAFMASKYGSAQLNKNASGSVVRYIEAPGIKKVLIPNTRVSFQQEVDDLIQKSARLREEAADMLEKSKNLLKEKAGLDNLVSEDYDYYGHRSADRKVSCFSIKQKEITTTTINAFNYSRRILNTKSKIQSTVPLKEVLLYNDVFSTGSFPRVEVSGNNGIMLINQSDIFDAIIKGKRISKRRVKTDNLVEYGEVLIAGVGTLGDSEKFCHVIFANEDLVGQLVSGEFIRMKTTKEVTSGYLFAWLDTDYGFRLIRNTQAGTKLCRPIPRMLLEIPVPLIDSDSMQEIDRLVREAHTKRYQANCNERKAISMVEKEIESWTTSKKN
ncbi:methylation-associated defense system restriction endonuclease subunit S MAD5 [Prevotella histicola]|uniref:methylation-associated defense system restriction endonuclease subunit S MAD5 n=1 Tax=Prevotella histicola TaxID=470565 RepID=UPI00288A3228|nr:restriction endonuclease subunit S [Prevotella histicola]